MEEVRKKILDCFVATLLAMTMLSVSAFAEDTAKPLTYNPEGCEFSVEFPTEPTIEKKCDPANAGNCYDLVSFTKVFEMSSTVNFRVICNKVSEEVNKHYSPEIMEATLKAMTEKTVVKTFDTSFREEKEYKQAGLVGESEVGRTSTIYIAQLWIGKHSALSMEAELIGEGNVAAEKLYSDVLKTVKYAGESSEVGSEKKEEKPDPRLRGDDKEVKTPAP